MIRLLNDGNSLLPDPLAYYTRARCVLHYESWVQVMRLPNDTLRVIIRVWLSTTISQFFRNSHESLMVVRRGLPRLLTFHVSKSAGIKPLPIIGSRSSARTP